MAPDEEDEVEPQLVELEQGLFFPSEVFRVGDIHVTPYNCPECLSSEQFDCDVCSYFSPKECVLLRQPDLQQDLRLLLNIARERNINFRRHHVELRQAIHAELKAHGRPLHYSIIVRMVAERFPHLEARPMRVLRILTHNPDLFACVVEGTFQSL